MPFIPLLNIVQARLIFQHVSGNVAQNIFYCATTSVPTATDLDEIGTAFQEWCVESVATALVNTWSIQGVALRAMNVAAGLEVNYTEDFPIAGSNTQIQAPLSASYTVTWGTGLAGRSFRGRTYGIGLSNQSIVDGKRLTDVAQADLQGRWENLLFIMETAGHALQVASFIQGGVPLAEGETTPILSANVRFPLASQRRRL